MSEIPPDIQRVLRLGIMRLGRSVVPPSYIIFKIGGMAYAKNGLTGRVEFSGADASEVIQHAVDVAGQQGGGVVVVRKGTYTITKTILVKYSNIRLVGYGAKLVSASGRTDVITLYDYAGNPIYTRATIMVGGFDSDIQNVVVEGFEVDGNCPGPNNATGVVENGIHVTGGARYVAVRNNLVYNVGDLGITVFGQVMRDTTRYKSQFILIDGNTVYFTCAGRDGIAADDAHTDIVISNNTVNGAPDFGIGFARNISRVAIIGNYVYNSRVGIFMRLMSDALVAGNYIYGCGVGIEEGIARIHIVGNIIRAGSVGIGRLYGYIHGNYIHSGVAGIVDVGGEVVGNHIEIIYSGYSGEIGTYGYGTTAYVGGVLQFGVRDIRAPSIIKDNVIVAPDISARPERQSWPILFSNRRGDYTPETVIDDNIIRNGRIAEQVTSSNNTYRHNRFDNILSFTFASGTRLSRNVGYQTEASGVATITTGSTRVTVSHGLATAPNKIIITPYANVRVWVENITGTSFDIVTDVAPASDVNVAWYAEV
jgi:hypothetical protein